MSCNARPSTARQFDNLSVVALRQRNLADKFERDDLSRMNGNNDDQPVERLRRDDSG